MKKTKPPPITKRERLNYKPLPFVIVHKYLTTPLQDVFTNYYGLSFLKIEELID